MPIAVTDAISIDEDEIRETFLPASGPGGQNVNKVATAVQLRFDAAGSTNLPPGLRERLRKLAGARMTRDGAIVILAQRYRTQRRNREDAIERLLDLLRRAAVPPVKRRPTRPTAAARRKRLADKSLRALRKTRRKPVEVQD